MATPVFGPHSGPKTAVLAYAERVRAKRLDEVRSFVDRLYELGDLIGIDAFLLAAQSAHETGDPATGYGWHSPAWVERLNPAGIGITDRYDYGIAFRSGHDAATALVIHHCAYVLGRVPEMLRSLVHLDPRYDAVFSAGFAGSVKYWEDYGNGKWASDPQYAAKVLSKARDIRGGNVMPRIFDWWLTEDRWVNGEFYPGVVRYYENRAGYTPKIIVVHIQEGSNLGSWMHFHDVKASCTVMIAKNGDIWRVVPEQHAPWTNGDVCSPTQKGVQIMNQYGWDPNYYALTIETEGFTGEWPKPQAQLDSVLWQIREWMRKYGIPKSHILRHADINQCSRARCPGDAYFNWIMEHIDDATVTPRYAAQQPVMVNGKPWDGSKDVTVNGITFHAEKRAVTVAVDGLKAHQWASTKSPEVRSPLEKGEQFEVLGWVQGERVENEDRWWVSKHFSRIWVGGTVEKPSVKEEEQPKERGDDSISDVAPRLRFGLLHYRVSPDGTPRKVKVVKQAVVRKVPLTGTDVVRNVNPGDELEVVEWTQGAEVHGETIWWRLKDGGYLWVAATDSRPY